MDAMLQQNLSWQQEDMKTMILQSWGPYYIRIQAGYVHTYIPRKRPMDCTTEHYWKPNLRVTTCSTISEGHRWISWQCSFAWVFVTYFYIRSGQPFCSWEPSYLWCNWSVSEVFLFIDLGGSNWAMPMSEGAHANGKWNKHWWWKKPKIKVFWMH